MTLPKAIGTILGVGVTLAVTGDVLKKTKLKKKLKMKKKGYKTVEEIEREVLGL